MYCLLHETDEPTAVNFSVSGQFLPGSGRQLITAGAKCLKVYRLNPYVSVPDEEGSEETATRLECLLTCSLMASVRGLSAARVPMQPLCDSIVMTFDDAKVSVVSIDPATMTLNTLSLHSIEDDFLRDGYSKDNFSPELRVDPAQRCAAFLVYGRHLGIVPFQDGAKEQLLASYTIPLRSFDERLENILDFIFLEGYYEPTVLFLYEPIKGTAGRASIRYDTVSILGVSLNPKDKIHAVVWSFGGLPMTIDRCLQVPQPVNGVLLFGANEIVYLNQSAPPCGLALNSCAVEYSKFPLSDLRQMGITLDGCVVEAEGPNAVFLALRSGDLYVLTLVTDATNSVKELKLAKVLETCSPHTASLLAPGYLFIGSRIGNSALLHYSSKRSVESIEDRGKLDVANGVKHAMSTRATFWEKAKEVEMDPNRPDGAMDAATEDEFQSLYNGASEPSAVDMERIGGEKEYEFVVRQVDSLLNVGPCKVVKCTSPNNELNPTLVEGARDVCFDLVSASGHGKDSSLCFFERTLRPDVFTTSPLENAIQFWTVCRKEDGYHKYLLVARELSTVVLELGSVMVELEVPLFVTSETTVAAGELEGGEIAVQITPTSIVLAHEGRLLLGPIGVETNFPIASASIEDPFLALLTQNGRMLLYRLESIEAQHNLVEVQTSTHLKHERTPITAISLYKDNSGMTKFCKRTKGDIGMGVDESFVDTAGDLSDLYSSSFVEKKRQSFTEGTAGDDIDMLLYGEEQFLPQKLEKSFEEGMGEQEKQHPSMTSGGVADEWADVRNPSHVVHTYWLLLARENGNLYVHNLPDMQLVYMVRRFNQLPDTIIDDYASVREDNEGVPATHSQQQEQAVPQPTIEALRSIDPMTTVKPEEVIMELRLTGLGYNRARPVLSILIDDMAVFYEMFTYDAGIPGHLAIRFRRLKCCVVTRSTRYIGPNGKAPVEAVRDSSERYRPLIVSFEMGDRIPSGLFICGAYPTLMFIERGEPRLHPMTIDGPIRSFTSFNNVNCLNGFLYLTKESFMRIAQLQPEVIYDASFPTRKVPFPECTLHNVVFSRTSKVYALVTSICQPSNKLCVLVSEDKQIETLDREETFVPPTLEHYSLRLFSSEDWAYVPDAELKMDEFEVITCCDEVLLNSESTVTGVKNYLAVGTVVNYGEEIYARGKIILCEFADVVPEADQPTSRHKIKVVYSKEQKGPLTSLCACNGYLLTGMGQKIFIWQFRDGELTGVSFLDMHFYIHSIVPFRNLALACDLYRSLSLLRYQEQFKALSVVSRDLRPTAPAPMTSQFLVDHQHIGFILSDEAGNLTLFSYSPEIKESGGGERLIIRASLNIGSLVNTFVRFKGHTSEPFIENAAQASGTQNCYFATLDGSFGVVRPLSEKLFRRLHMLQQVMTMHIPQAAGLNPRGSRFSRPQSSATSQQISTARNLVDGNLVFQYLHLSVAEKAELTKKASITSRYQILDDLVEISRLTTHY